MNLALRSMARHVPQGEASSLMSICFGLLIVSLGLPWIRGAWWPLIPIAIGACFLVRGLWLAWANRRA